jgi:hypothetical protein
MPWLLRDDDVLAFIEDRRKGWRVSLQGAVVLHCPSLMPTFTSKQALDLAWCSQLGAGQDGRRLKVRKIASISPHRVAGPRLRSGLLLVARAGAFERWKLQVGDQLEIHEA